MDVLGLEGWAALILGGSSFLVVYLVSLPLSGALTREDLTQFETMADFLGPLRGVVRWLFSLMSRLIDKK